MAALQARPYDAADEETWDRLVAISWNGTFLHTRRYLGYHGERFADASLLVEDARGRVLGVFPAAVDPVDPSRVVSHPGITYGGVVHAGRLQGPAMLDALAAIARHYAATGFARLVYKVVPHIYHRVPCGDDSYALFRLDAQRLRCDLSASVDLSNLPSINRNRRRNLDRAESAGLELRSGSEWIAEFWVALTANLLERFGVPPVHSVEEMNVLASLFPNQIECQAVLRGNVLLAGVLLYKTGRVVHPQYSAAAPHGREVGALDLAFSAGIASAHQAGAGYYDFGNSNTDGGRVLNESLYAYKASYGAGGVPYECFELTLEGPS